MSKPEGYPFLRIAKQYDVPYDVVLKVADDMKRTGRANWLDFPNGTDPLTMIAVADATDIQQSVRDGYIHWETGEPLCPDEGCPHYGTPHSHPNDKPAYGADYDPTGINEPVNSVGSYYAKDGTLMNADGTRSIFDDVDK